MVIFNSLNKNPSPEIRLIQFRHQYLLPFTAISYRILFLSPCLSLSQRDLRDSIRYDKQKRQRRSRSRIRNNLAVTWNLLAHRCTLKEERRSALLVRVCSCPVLVFSWMVRHAREERRESVEREIPRISRNTGFKAGNQHLSFLTSIHTLTNSSDHWSPTRVHQYQLTYTIEQRERGRERERRSLWCRPTRDPEIQFIRKIKPISARNLFRRKSQPGSYQSLFDTYLFISYKRRDSVIYSI